MTFSKFNGYSPDGRRLYAKGGGGDPGKEMREQEAARQKRVNASMEQIDRTFSGGGPGVRGVGAADAGNLTSAGTYYDAAGNPITLPDWQAGSFFDKNRAKQEAQRLASEGLYTGTEAVPATKGFDDDYYKSIADKWLEYQMPLFTEQLTEARRALPLSFASTGGSAYLRKSQALETDALRREAELRDQATDQSNQQRAEVERARSDLVGLANAGTDASAVAQMASGRAAALAKPPSFSPIADLFQKYTAGFANSRIAANQGQVRRESPLLFNSNANSVRNVGA